MASSYAAFDVLSVDSAGVQSLVGAGVSVAIRKIGSGSDEAESPLTTDANGHIAAGSLASVTVGTIVYFRVENYNGVAGTLAQVTT